MSRTGCQSKTVIVNEYNSGIAILSSGSAGSPKANGRLPGATVTHWSPYDGSDSAHPAAENFPMAFAGLNLIAADSLATANV